MHANGICIVYKMDYGPIADLYTAMFINEEVIRFYICYKKANNTTILIIQSNRTTNVR